MPFDLTHCLTAVSITRCSSSSKAVRKSVRQRPLSAVCRPSVYWPHLVIHQI